MCAETETGPYILKQNRERPSVVEQGTRLIQRAVVTPFTGSKAASAAVAVDVETEVLQLAAALYVCGWRVANKCPLIGLPARCDLYPVLIHGRRVAAVRVLQRCAGNDGRRKRALAVRIRGSCAHLTALAC